jgi:hypothetical protein
MIEKHLALAGFVVAVVLGGIVGSAKRSVREPGLEVIKDLGLAKRVIQSGTIDRAMPRTTFVGEADPGAWIALPELDRKEAALELRSALTIREIGDAFVFAGSEIVVEISNSNIRSVR